VSVAAWRVHDLQSDDGGGCFMSRERVVGFSDPEMDMDRVVRVAARFRMWRLIAVLKRLIPGFFTVESPKRSVDRELQEVLSPWR
jgi:hypothetical protein